MNAELRDLLRLIALGLAVGVLLWLGYLALGMLG
jgi:hypothetical protein